MSLWPKRQRDPNGSALISQTSDLRDQLLSSVAKLDQYAEALKVEVERLKQLADQQAKDRKE